MGRKGGRLRCPYDHKSTFRKWDDARKMAHRLPDSENRIYWCPQAGGYHIARGSSDEYDRRQAPNFKEEGVEKVEQEKVVESQQIGRGGDCPTCGQLYGFHDSILHSYHEVPEHLTWKPGALAPWQEEIFFKPYRPESKAEDDVTSTLSVLKGLTADDVV